VNNNTFGVAVLELASGDDFRVGQIGIHPSRLRWLCVERGLWLYREVTVIHVDAIGVVRVLIRAFSAAPQAHASSSAGWPYPEFSIRANAEVAHVAIPQLEIAQNKPPEMRSAT